MQIVQGRSVGSCLAEKAAQQAQKQEQAEQWPVAQGRVRSSGLGEMVSFWRLEASGTRGISRMKSSNIWEEERVATPELEMAICLCV